MSSEQEKTQIALTTGTITMSCPVCHSTVRAGWEVPRNGIGVVCHMCGAWCVVGGRT